MGCGAAQLSQRGVRTLRSALCCPVAGDVPCENFLIFPLCRYHYNFYYIPFSASLSKKQQFNFELFSPLDSFQSCHMFQVGVTRVSSMLLSSMCFILLSMNAIHTATYECLLPKINTNMVLPQTDLVNIMPL